MMPRTVNTSRTMEASHAESAGMCNTPASSQCQNFITAETG